MPKLDLDEVNVKEIELTVEEVNYLLDGNTLEALEIDLDQAQGDVKSEVYKEYYVVLKVVKG